MEPGYQRGDKVTVTSPPKHLKTGMVVIYRDPAPLNGNKNFKLMHRVVGVGGDHVSCCDDHGRITINGVPLDESSYLQAGIVASEQPFDVTVPRGFFWALGDNRPDSFDSRAEMGDENKGFVPVKNLVGLVRTEPRH